MPPLALRIKVFHLIIVPLCPNYFQFVFLNSVHDALTEPRWKDAKIEEMMVMHKNITWELVQFPKDIKTMGCKLVYTIKQKAAGSIKR